MSLYPNTYVIEMLNDMLVDEATDAAYYKKVAEIINDSADSDIVRRISMDEEKHYKMLKDIYKKLEGEEMQDAVANDKTLANNTADIFSSAVMGELAGAEAYRTLMFALANPQLRDYVFEILTDEQEHAALMNYLFAKYN
jgi:rubrerythrin